MGIKLNEILAKAKVIAEKQYIKFWCFKKTSETTKRFAEDSTIPEATIYKQ